MSGSTRRSVVSLVVAAWRGCVAKVPPATLASVQIVTARREEAVFPLRTNDQHSLNLKTDHWDYSHTEISTFPQILKNTFPPSTLSSLMDILHLSYSLQDQVLDLNLVGFALISRLTTVGFFLACVFWAHKSVTGPRQHHTMQLQATEGLSSCPFHNKSVWSSKLTKAVSWEKQ